MDHLHQKKTHGIFLRPKNRILGEILNLQKSSDFEDHFEYYFEAVELTNQPTVKPEIFQISQTPKNKTVPLVFFFFSGDGVHRKYHLQITDLEKDEVRALGGLLVASSAGAMEGVPEASPG